MLWVGLVSKKQNKRGEMKKIIETKNGYLVTCKHRPTFDNFFKALRYCKEQYLEVILFINIYGEESFYSTSILTNNKGVIL